MKPITKLSPKQKLVLKWAHLTKFKNRKAIICDGSVRSGKTVSMILGFVHWAMRFFDGKNFGICGKTISSTERNIILPLLNMPDITDYYSLQYIRGEISELSSEAEATPIHSSSSAAKTKAVIHWYRASH